ncbi:hypothetical protein SK128_012632 [Halocaridina rubra]|uniref:Uncharacterized protein n=1 Tax=Halocaridina rubra TaxID=373956 RepID=A0AAN8WMB7_HALRR
MIRNTLLCFVPSTENYVIYGSIEAAPAPSFLPERAKENLMDGIYNVGDMTQCYLSSASLDSWFRVDLGSVKPVHRVILVLQSTTTARKVLLSLPRTFIPKYGNRYGKRAANICSVCYSSTIQ